VRKKIRNPNPSKTNPLSGTKLLEWGLLSRASLTSLIVSEERRAWILETYPPEETGRPGIIVVHARGDELRKTDAGRELSGNDFADDEVALADEKELVEAAG
jgi:hypothetical protein